MKKRKIRYLLLAALCCLVQAAAAQATAPKPKRIFITLDVSSSMKGNKYVMANYAAQALTVFSGTEDAVTVYYLGARHAISGAEGYKELQRPYDSHRGNATYAEVSDLTQFLRDYHPDEGHQDWLFIIGDGDWDYKSARPQYDATTRRLAELLAGGHLQVCYLQTGDKLTEEYAFTHFLTDLHSDQVDVRRSDTTAASVLDGCIHFANKILGFSNTSVQMKHAGQGRVTFCSELPLERCLLVWQTDQAGTRDIAITSATCRGRRLTARVKGNPSARPLVEPGTAAVNGIVWELSSTQTIPAGDTVEVRFSQDVDVRRLTLYPFVDVAVGVRPWSAALDTLTEASPDCYRLCDKERQVLVKISITDHRGHKFPPPLMQRMDVKLSTEAGEQAADYCADDTTFQVLLPMEADTLSYLARVECPGYFSRFSPRQTVVKAAGVCPPEHLPLQRLAVQHFGTITFGTIRGGETFGGQIVDSLFAAVAPLATFDEQSIEETSESGYFGHVRFEYGAGGRLTFRYRPSGDWCECAFPDTLTYLVTLRSTRGVRLGDQVHEGFIIPVAVPMDHRPWLLRCRLYLIALLALLLLEIYFIALLKKNRFHRTARFRSSYANEDQRREVESGGRRLRQPGLGAWLSRWLNPFGAERCTMSFTRPRTGAMTFVASPSKNRVLMTGSSFNPKTMSVPNYVPRPADEKKARREPVNIAVGTSIAFKRTQGSTTTTLGHLKLTSEAGDDEGSFRTFIAVLMLLGLVALAFVAYMLLHSWY